MKKLLALVLFIALMCSTLISCDLFQKEPEVYVETAEDVIEKADAALLEAPYKVTLKMEYESNNREINAIISPLSMEMPMIIDGNNVAMDMTVKSNGSYVDVKARVVDKVMYYDVITPGQIVKIKAKPKKVNRVVPTAVLMFLYFFAPNNRPITILHPALQPKATAKKSIVIE